MSVGFPAIMLTVAILAILLGTRQNSLEIINSAGEFDGRDRYERGARWGWLMVVGSFAVVVGSMIVFAGHSTWDLRATALAWATACLPIAGSIGLLMIPEFMGYWVWAQSAWDEMGGKHMDWLQYRAIAARLETGRTRWLYYGAWVVGSLGLTVGPLWTCVAVQG
ncbi:MAG: hypothetical protein GF393_09950 [Armatimonadia bacterium]|nr:hypothetical protein [Armatimonadia bacterium]